MALALETEVTRFPGGEERGRGHHEGGGQHPLEEHRGTWQVEVGMAPALWR